MCEPLQLHMLLYTAVKKPRIQDLLGKSWLSQNTFASGTNAEWRLSGDSGESFGRPSKIPVRAMESCTRSFGGGVLKALVVT